MLSHLGEWVIEFDRPTRKTKDGAKSDALVMHPGPMVRGMELTGEIADGPQSVILDQVRNGVAIRMAILASALQAASSGASS